MRYFPFFNYLTKRSFNFSDKGTLFDNYINVYYITLFYKRLNIDYLMNIDLKKF